MKAKRAKPFAANNASVKKLEAEGWTVAVVEQTIPHCFIKRDFMGFADLIACSPSRGIMAVQVTGGASRSNANARIRKIRQEPRHALWLASGGRLAVHNWLGTGKVRVCEVFNFTTEQKA